MTTIQKPSHDVLNELASAFEGAGTGITPEAMTREKGESIVRVLRTLSVSPKISDIIVAVSIDELERPSQSWTAARFDIDVFGLFAYWNVGSVDAQVQLRPEYETDTATLIGWTAVILGPAGDGDEERSLHPMELADSPQAALDAASTWLTDHAREGKGARLG